MGNQAHRVAGSAEFQGRLWGVHAGDWALAREGMVRPLYEAAFQRIGLGPSKQILDVGCGSGYAGAIADQMGAQVTGLDASFALIEIAKNRVPGGDFRVGEMEDLPFADLSFDVVTGFNSFQYAADPVHALVEARRVVRPTGVVVIGLWGRAVDSEAATLFRAVRPLLSPDAPFPDPLALSGEGVLDELVAAAGLTPEVAEEVQCTFTYPDLGTTLKGLLASAPMVMAINLVGMSRVRDAVVKALAPFKLASGGYRLKNRFRYLVTKP